MKYRILVIDDEPTVRLLLEKFLTKLDYEVTCKEDGLKALEWLEGNLPHLIICDIDMPNMGGYDFLKFVRQRGYTKRTPVIMLSGNDSGPDRVRCYKGNAQDFVAKPFNLDELSELIKKNLDPIHYALKW